jgi:hypothetical protein
LYRPSLKTTGSWTQISENGNWLFDWWILGQTPSSFLNAAFVEMGIHCRPRAQTAHQQASGVRLSYAFRLCLSGRIHEKIIETMKEGTFTTNRESLIFAICILFHAIPFILTPYKQYTLPGFYYPIWEDRLFLYLLHLEIWLLLLMTEGAKHYLQRKTDESLYSARQEEHCWLLSA